MVKLIKGVLLTLIIFNSSSTLLGQEKDSVRNRSFLNPWNGLNGIRLTLGYFKHFESEIAFIVTNYPDKDPGLGGLAGFQSFSIGAKYLYANNIPVYGASITYQKVFGFLAFQIGADQLFDNSGNTQMRIIPSVGLTFAGHLSLLYSYNINMFDDKLKFQSPSLISIQIPILKKKRPDKRFFNTILFPLDYTKNAIR